MGQRRLHLAQRVGWRHVQDPTGGRQIGREEARMGEHGLGDRWVGGVEDRRPLALEQRQRPIRLEERVRHEAGAGDRAHQERADSGKVKQRARRPQTIGRRQAVDPGHVRPAAHERLVGEDAAAGLRGRARGVQNQRGAPDAHAGPAPCELFPSHLRGELAELLLIERSRAAAMTEDGDAAQPRRGLQVQTAGIRCAVKTGQGLLQQTEQVDVVVDPVAGQDRGELRVGDHVGQLDRSVAGVDRNQDRAGERDRVDRRDAFGAVGHQQAHVLAGLDADPDQSTGERLRSVGKLGV